MLKPFVFSFITVLFIFSCSENTNNFSQNKVIVPFDTLTFLLSDIHILDAAAKQNYLNNNANNLFRYSQNKALLNKYHISKYRFDSTIVFYTTHTKEFMVVYDSSIAIIKKQLDHYTKNTNLPVSAQMGKKPDSLQIRENANNLFNKKDRK